MRAIFPNSFDTLKRDRLYTASVYERLNLIINNVAKEFNYYCKDSLFHSAFKFQEEDSNGTSHFIIHFTKHKKGFELVKQIYYDFDNIGTNLESEGVYMFDAKRLGSIERNAIDFGDTNVSHLASLLYEEYKGRTITSRALFDEHHVDKKYSASHYTKTLRKMATDNKLSATFTDNVAHKVTVLISDHCVLKFK